SGRWPAYLARSGLGSNRSAWNGPPFMKRWMTLLARGAKWTAELAAPAIAGSAKKGAAPKTPRPPPRVCSSARRGIEAGEGRWVDIGGIRSGREGSEAAPWDGASPPNFNR